jgi:hypothetical protein
MFIPFNDLSPAARIWVYQADRKITEYEKNIITQHLRTFTEEWLVHGAPVDASFEVIDDLFVVLAANDPTSGCSIDSSVRALKELGTKASIDFFNRNLVAFRLSDRIELIDLKALKQTFLKGVWDENTLTYNNLVANKEELMKSWLVPAGRTWLKRYAARPQSV